MTGILIFLYTGSRKFFFLAADPKRCDRCGYNLTGNVSGTCPECGTAVEAGAVAEDPD